MKGRVPPPPPPTPIERGGSVADFARFLMGWLAVILLVAALIIWVVPAKARDDGRFAASALKPWFDSLRSGKGLCCSDADGSALSDADWETRGGKFFVHVPTRPAASAGEQPAMEWVEVPEDAVITEPNRVGRTMVWPIYGYQGLSIRCFLPGSMT